MKIGIRTQPLHNNYVELRFSIEKIRLLYPNSLIMSQNISMLISVH